MSISIDILKKIEGFSLEAALNSVQQAAIMADMHCIGVETLKYFGSAAEEEEEYLEGALSEVNAETLKQMDHEEWLKTRLLSFVIQKPYKYAYDSYTWLINKANYFNAFYLQYVRSERGDFEFAFQFLSQYFQLKENIHDYLWVGGEDWFYSAEDMIWLSKQPYNPEWPAKKLTAPQT